MSDAKPYTLDDFTHVSDWTGSPHSRERTMATVRALDAANARVAELEACQRCRRTDAKFHLCGDCGDEPGVVADLHGERDEWKALAERAEARDAEVEAALADVAAIAREFDRRNEETKGRAEKAEELVNVLVEQRDEYKGEADERKAEAAALREALIKATTRGHFCSCPDCQQARDTLAKLEGR